MTEPRYKIKPLSSIDRKKLSQQYIYALAFLIVVGAIFIFIYKYVLTPSHFTSIPIVVFSLFGLVFSAVISYIIWTTFLDFKKGIKYCYTGFITDKHISKHFSSSKRFNAKSGNSFRRTSTKTYYGLSIDNTEFSVSYVEYNKAEVGNKIYLELSPKKKEILAFTILEKNQESNITHFKEIYSIPNQIQHSTQFLNKEEIELVKRIFFKKLRTQLIFIVAYFLLLILLWQGIFIFLVPVIVVSIYASVKLLILLNQYTKFSRNVKRKQLKTVQVLDKFKASSNRSRTLYRLVTNFGNVDVSKKIYNKVQTNHSIQLHTESVMNILVAVSFNSSHFYVLNHDE
ncbi:hypothetical protein ACU8DI_12110 [Psychroserpens sp. BH13MA-6]